MNRLAAFLSALLLLALPALVSAHEEHQSQQNARLPVIGPAPPFTLTSQDGAPVSLASLRGKVVAVTFIYTTCPDVCPLLTQKMARVQDELGPRFGSKVNFVSITVDPERDTPAVLKGYARNYGARLDGWNFLTGSPTAIRDVTKRYGVFVAKQEDGSVDHTALTSIIDGDGEMRVQYLGSRFDPEEFRRDLLSLVGKE